jgi:hypothetical protein
LKCRKDHIHVAHNPLTVLLDLFQIVWPENWTTGSDNITDNTFIISVDGTHCAIDEPKHAVLSQDPAYFSHKMNRVALAYEVALSLFENRVVSVNGPFPERKNQHA